MTGNQNQHRDDERPSPVGLGLSLLLMGLAVLGAVLAWTAGPWLVRLASAAVAVSCAVIAHRRLADH